jgi:Membrane protease subunits, stomatin/prohibitin homologs
MDKLFIFLAVVAVVVVIIIMAIVVKLKKNSTKSKDVSDANLDFLKKSEKGREILASIQLSQAELKRAKLNEDTAGTHERVIEIEKRILDLDREVTEARLHSESVDKKNDASEGKNAGAENLSSGSGKNSSHIAEYREGANNLGRWVFIWSIAITASATLCIVAGLACIASLGFSWVTIPTGLGIIAIWFGMAMLYIPTKISGIATIKEGYVGVLSAFDKYSGTVNPGIFFPIALINSYKSMNVGEQTMPINLVKTNEDDKAVEIDDHVSIGVESTVFYRITKEGAHLALFNINSAEKGGYKKALSKLLESMLKAHFSKEKFSTVNDTRGKSLILELFKPDGVMIDENKNDFSDEELIGLLQKSKNWCDIRDNWGILVLDIVIDNLIFSKED